MLLVSHKIVFIENEAALLYVPMREHTEGFAAIIQLIAYMSSFFVVHFSNAFQHGKKAFPKSSSFIQLIQGCENMFSLAQLSKSKFFHPCRNRVVRTGLVSHLCCTHVTNCLALIMHSCCTPVALVLLALHSCRSSLALVLQNRLDKQIIIGLQELF